ncbi:DEAD/DEAH box helicase [Nocardia cyriacigeorgica]|uniref:DEAD/DEAH box helicase n=3 Tax=Nocardia cyriacigeorgica TaxID=135487 RepID=UPI001894BABA|nr:DEAD/DEAH box helicase [Nocardia cyriacigeorgica]MBF6455553.1 DEAD/DEAH box helicase [Nocardia cyriacigeorgica]MBF6553705.1 DEAD/DEAH box helicase [Nocardia cyriacigeorgica]
MGALLPTLQANRLREGLTDYLATTFALTDPDTQAALTDFVGDPKDGMFKGPYVRLRLPFAPARGNWGMHLDWLPKNFVPYGHQAKAFERLSTKFQQRPQPTLVTTGTGSGKTESFLIPILDHVVRAKKQGVAGMKALIIYPMNALANDQEQRLAKLISTHPELTGVTAGLYTGEQSSGGRTLVSAEGLITDRRLMHDSPPDILLTNYKMLDHLLLRPDRAAMWRQSAQSLQYVVLDEFHTYDGAQGTDVAMLLRRLGLAVKSYWTDSSPVTDEDRARPLGRITPVATSATLGGGGEPTAMLEFAHTVFGEVFDADSLVTETRLELQEWLADRDTGLDRRYAPIVPSAAQAVTDLDDLIRHRSPTNAHLTAAVLATLFERTGDEHPSFAELTAELRRLDETEQLDLLKKHHWFVRLLTRSTEATSLADLAAALLSASSAERDNQRARATRQRYLDYVFAALSHLRAEIGRAALNVDVHLWIRELSRIDRELSAAPTFRWGDDGGSEATVAEYASALYCRHCGRSGWGVRLAPTGHTLDPDQSSVRSLHLSGNARIRALISAPVEAQLDPPLSDLRWLRIEDREISDETPDPDSTEVQEGRVLPVLILHGPGADDDSTKDVCPACNRADGIRFLGSAIATQLSVALSNMFGDAELDADEKKALMFTDSVQDAAHRAGFVQARSHTLSLRSTLRNALGEKASGTDTLTLTELCDAVIDRAGDDPIRRYHLLAPDIVESDEFGAFWKLDTTAAKRREATKKVRRRVQFDIDLEFGLQSRLGRTLELTGSVVAEVDLGSQDRVARLGTRALDDTEYQLSLSEIDSAAIVRWVRGTVERMRTQGAIRHTWLDKYVQRDANRRWVWGGRPRGEGMPAFPKGRPAPAFPAIGARNVPEGFDPITAPSSWYAQWASRCLGVASFEGGFLARSLFAVLADERILTTVTTEKSLTAYQLSEDGIRVGAPTLNDLEASRHLLVCGVCQTQNPGTATVVDQLDGAPCLLIRCPGSLHRAPKSDNFYRSLYDRSEMKRVVAREHTSLLPTPVRLEYETKFKQRSVDPTAPNVLVATPTLEMGIDIGDLSTVMLGSLPRTVASYLQRVGRAGRLTGNSLILAFVRGRGEHLPKLYDPTSVISGQVRPPATFLTAEEILQRQYIAHMVDQLARRPGAQDPVDARAVLSSFDEGTWMAGLIELANVKADELVDGFLAQFDGLLSEESRNALRTWATPTELGEPSAMVGLLREAVHRWNRDVAELTERRTAVDTALPEFEQRANSPAATDDDRRDLRSARATLRLLGKHLHDLTREHWVGVLERYGVLPNYTLLDDSVTLDVGITWFDPETHEYQGDTESYRRGARVALTELAPGSTFYAQGLAVKIDAVDLGPGEANIHLWRTCPQCGWIGTSTAVESAVPPSRCPRCATSAIADISQQLQVVEMAKVSAEVRRDEAAITDARDERQREMYAVVTAADINPDNVARRWFATDYDFGAEYLRQIDIRWLNLGRRTSQGGRRIIAGSEITTGLFRVCSGCGQLDRIAGRNDPHEHRSWCKYRKASTEDHVRDIALARTLRTQGVLLHVPSFLRYDSFAYPSLSAAILLGLRQVIGGSPEHLDVVAITDALYEQNQQALLIHDTVPGGTGYLAEFAEPRKVWSALRAARDIVRNCSCADEQRLACHKCLLPFTTPHEQDKVSRRTAAKILDAILGAAEGEPAWEPWAASLVESKKKERQGSKESPLEREFYVAFLNRLRTLGATIKETPGTYANKATITVPGQKIRTWTLTPQVQMGNSLPDFELKTTDPDIPVIAIFADGHTYHASEENNRVADDARKRAILRSGGVLVWSFGYEDLQRFTGQKKQVAPSWHTKKMAELAMKQGNLRPAVFELVKADPITQLFHFMNEPDLEAWSSVGRWLPLMLMRDNRCKGDSDGLADWALNLLDDQDAQIPAGQYACFNYRDGALTATVAFRPGGPIQAVLVFDDRDDGAAVDRRSAWQEWLRLSNWFGLHEAHLVTSRKLLTDETPTPATAAQADTTDLGPQWQSLYDNSISDQERALIRELAAAGTPVPTQGFESDDGEVIDIAWPGPRVGVLFDDVADAADTIASQGWTVCGPEITPIVAALTANGVM